MRGQVSPLSKMFCLLSPESRVPQHHPLRRVKVLVDDVPRDLSPLFDEMYAELGRPSIPPECLLKAKVLQALYAIRSEVLLVEALDHNLHFRWFLDFNLLDPVEDHCTFSENQTRLLQHRSAELFFARIVGPAREHGWVSDAHFTVDGTLIDAFASLKSFQPNTGAKPPTDGDAGNPTVDFHGERRSNATHESTTDREARLLRKAKGKEAEVTSATGAMETAAATELLARHLDQAERAPQTVGADKGYHNAEWGSFCREHDIAPHVAEIKDRKVTDLDGRTTRTLGYQTSQNLRMRIEEIFDWCKEIGGLRRTRKRGVDRVGLSALLILSSYNLVRMAKLLGSPPRPPTLATT